MPRRATTPVRARPLAWSCRPEALLAVWPADRPLAALISAGGHARWARWSILAAPVNEFTGDSGDPLDSIDRICAGARASGPRTDVSAGDSAPPFVGGWIGWLGYDLGRSIEPAAQAASTGGATGDAASPSLRLLHCPGAYVYDHVESAWWIVGDDGALPRLTGVESSSGGAVPRFTVARLRSEMGREAFERAVRRVKELIGAGDVFQVNIAHRLSCEFEGSTRALFGAMLEATGPWYGACIESLQPGEAVLSVSPELFLGLDGATRSVVTRPIKGTRPERADAAELERSEKDAAELVMIVDLMRNDLGRVCEIGSVRVEEARTIERHGAAGRAAREGAGVRHGVATVSGRLRADVTIGGLLLATFPPGSVTGAPKIRAMQIIDELEPVRRGPYCGAVGFISDNGSAAFNVAIRTAVVRGSPKAATGSADTAHDQIRGALRYSVGAGIVADSDPSAEWAETMDKAAGFAKALDAGDRAAVPPPPLAGAQA